MTSTNAQMARGASNFAALFADRVEATPDKEAFRYQDRGEWVSVTWRDTACRVFPPWCCLGRPVGTIWRSASRRRYAREDL
jgi:hypothetical protein